MTDAPTHQQIERERDQMLDHWRKAFADDRCWVTDPTSLVDRVMDPKTADRRMQVRRLHDKLGFCAKGKLTTGGLCAGAIFRTGKFIAMPQAQRSGSKSGTGQTVHIEHTVPICVLGDRLSIRRGNPGADRDVDLAWLLRHSVATATTKAQVKEKLKGVSYRTSAFDDRSDQFGLPFRRYDQLLEDGETVWNVWDRIEVRPREFTFDDHWRVIQSVLHEVGAKSFAAKLDAARPRGAPSQTLA